MADAVPEPDWLHAAETDTQHWTNAWGGIWAAATAGQLGAALAIHDPETKKDLWVGSASSALGLIPTWIIQPQILRGDLNESRLDEYARDDRERRSWFSHASNVFVNVGIGLILGEGFGHWGSAALSVATGIPLGELMILTYPASSSREEDRRRSVQTSFTLIPSPGGSGAAVVLNF